MEISPRVFLHSERYPKLRCGNGACGSLNSALAEHLSVLVVAQLVERQTVDDSFNRYLLVTGSIPVDEIFCFYFRRPTKTDLGIYRLVSLTRVLRALAVKLCGFKSHSWHFIYLFFFIFIKYRPPQTHH